jgi:hypothetical protein
VSTLIEARLRQEVNALYHRLMRHVQKHGWEGKLCEHVTLRPPHLPCPHPDCLEAPSPILVVERFPDEPIFYSVGDVTKEPTAHRERWRVERLINSGDVFWGWRRID